MPQHYGYGYARSGAIFDSPRVIEAGTQERSLIMLAELAQRASVHPDVRMTAMKVLGHDAYGGADRCGARDDLCELQAIFDTIKKGDQSVAPFAQGFKYVADPRFADYFASPADTIRNCLKGACGGDCDDHCLLMMAMLASIGWKVGARAWGRKNAGGFSHVYAVVAFPKRPDEKGRFDRVIAMDTTVEESVVGWEPPKGEVLTAWIG